jgi:hypothetical protein
MTPVTDILLASTVFKIIAVIAGLFLVYLVP